MDSYVIEFEDIINYWHSLFPEIKTREEFKEYIEKGMQMTLEELETQFFYSDPWNTEYDQWFTVKMGEELAFNQRLNVLLDQIIPEYRWAYFYKPMLAYHLLPLETFIEKVDLIQNKAAFLADFITYLVSSLHLMSFRTLILEVNIASEEGLLIGDSNQERADYFRDVLLKDNTYVQKLYKEYAELTRVMDTKIRFSIDFVKEIIQFTQQELQTLNQKFCPHRPIGYLEKINFDAGDTHNKGKRVSILKFSSGTKLIYKPRNLELDERYSDFITWLNNQNIPQFLNLQAAKVHFTSKAGWMEFIEYRQCEHPEEIQRYYHRIGQLLCLLYVLDSTDFHHENLIAHAEQPVLIDLETLMHVHLIDHDAKNSTAAQNVEHLINTSVKRNLLLPTQIINQADNKHIDLGGLSGDTIQKSHIKSIFINQYDSDQVHILKDYSEVLPQKNNPKLHDRISKSENFLLEINKGFSSTYRWLMTNKELVQKQIKHFFSSLDTRLLYKATAYYSQVMITSYHPDLLRHPLDRKVYLQRLALNREDYEQNIVKHEINDMLDGDIPLFTTLTDDFYIYNSGKNERVLGTHPNTIIDSIVAKIDSLCEEDFYRQLAFIQMSFYNRLPNGGRTLSNIRFQKAGQIDINSNSLLKYADEIGRFILNQSISGQKNGLPEIAWISNMEIAEDLQITTVSGIDLYSGNAGIAMLFAALFKLTNHTIYQEAVEQSLRPIIDVLDNYTPQNSSSAIRPNPAYLLGAFNGIAGSLYALFHIGDLLENEQLKESAFNYLRVLEDMLELELIHDVIGGAAGILSVLLSLYDKTPESKTNQKEYLLHLANKLFTKLQEQIVETDDGITWGEEGYTGFSHGNAGVSVSLMRLFQHRNNPEIIKLVEQSLCYERSMYDPKTNSWKRQLDNQTCNHNWCHGSSGILLSRLLLKLYGYADHEMMQEISQALQNTKQYGFGGDYCLCHGDIGNLRVLYLAADILKDEQLKLSCYATLEHFLNDFFIPNWEQGYFKTYENYELMTGLAGLGYGLLQFYKPGFLPEILWLQ